MTASATADPDRPVAPAPSGAAQRIRSHLEPAGRIARCDLYRAG